MQSAQQTNTPTAPRAPQTATVSLTFAVRDPDLLHARAAQAVEAHGMGMELDGTAAQAIVELLLHSNPAIESYLDYGIELLHETLSGR